MSSSASLEEEKNKEEDLASLARMDAESLEALPSGIEDPSSESGQQVARRGDEQADAIEAMRAEEAALEAVSSLPKSARDVCAVLSDPMVAEPRGDIPDVVSEPNDIKNIFLPTQEPGFDLIMSWRGDRSADEGSADTEECKSHATNEDGISAGGDTESADSISSEALDAALDEVLADTLQYDGRATPGVVLVPLSVNASDSKSHAEMGEMTDDTEDTESQESPRTEGEPTATEEPISVHDTLDTSDQGQSRGDFEQASEPEPESQADLHKIPSIANNGGPSLGNHPSEEQESMDDPSQSPPQSGRANGGDHEYNDAGSSKESHENAGDVLSEQSLHPDDETVEVKTEERSVETESLTKEASMVEPEAKDSAIAETDATEPPTTEPEAKEPATVEPDAKEPSTAEPDAKEPSTAEPDAKEPSTAEPDAKEPSTAEPDAKEPSTAEPTATTAKPQVPTGVEKSCEMQEQQRDLVAGGHSLQWNDPETAETKRNAHLLEVDEAQVAHSATQPLEDKAHPDDGFEPAVGPGATEESQEVVLEPGLRGAGVAAPQVELPAAVAAEANPTNLTSGEDQDESKSDKNDASAPADEKQDQSAETQLEEDAVREQSSSFEVIYSRDEPPLVQEVSQTTIRSKRAREVGDLKGRPHAPEADVPTAEKPARLDGKDAKRQYEPDTPSHLVRITVMGLAGIIVNPDRCRDVSGNKSDPAPPSEMRALVTVSDSIVSVGKATALSNKLMPVSSDPIVVNTTSTIDEEGNSRAKSPSIELQNQSMGARQLVAVWGENADAAVSFYINLAEGHDTKESGDGRIHNVSTSLSVNLALVEEGESGITAALPLGAAELPVSISSSVEPTLPNCLDLSLCPFSDDEESKNLPSSTLMEVMRKGKGLAGTVRPSMSAIDGFNEAYQCGEGIVRVLVEVHEVGSESEKRCFARSATDRPGKEPTEQVKDEESQTLRSRCSSLGSWDGDDEATQGVNITTCVSEDSHDGKLNSLSASWDDEDSQGVDFDDLCVCQPDPKSRAFDIATPKSQRTTRTPRNGGSSACTSLLGCFFPASFLQQPTELDVMSTSTTGVERDVPVEQKTVDKDVPVEDDEKPGEQNDDNEQRAKPSVVAQMENKTKDDLDGNAPFDEEQTSPLKRYEYISVDRDIGQNESVEVDCYVPEIMPQVSHDSSSTIEGPAYGLDLGEPGEEEEDTPALPRCDSTVEGPEYGEDMVEPELEPKPVQQETPVGPRRVEAKKRERELRTSTPVVMEDEEAPAPGDDGLCSSPDVPSKIVMVPSGAPSLGDLTMTTHEFTNSPTKTTTQKKKKPNKINNVKSPPETPKSAVMLGFPVAFGGSGLIATRAVRTATSEDMKDVESFHRPDMSSRQLSTDEEYMSSDRSTRVDSRDDQKEPTLIVEATDSASSVPPTNITYMKPESVLRSDSNNSSRATPISKSVSFGDERIPRLSQRVGSPSSLEVPSEVSVAGKTFNLNINAVRLGGRAFQEAYKDKVLAGLG